MARLGSTLGGIVNVRTRLVIEFVLGVVSGPFALASARAAKPPLGWTELAFLGFVSLVGVVFVTGLQHSRQKPAALIAAQTQMTEIGLFCLVAGVSAVCFASIDSKIDPSAFLFLLLGAGTSLGAWVSKAIFRAPPAT